MFPFGHHYNPGIGIQKSHQHIVFSLERHIFDKRYYPIFELTAHCKHIGSLGFRMVELKSTANSANSREKKKKNQCNLCNPW